MRRPCVLVNGRFYVFDREPDGWWGQRLDKLMQSASLVVEQESGRVLKNRFGAVSPEPGVVFKCRECEGTFPVERESDDVASVCVDCACSDRSTLALEEAWGILNEEEVSEGIPGRSRFNEQSKLKRLRALVYEAIHKTKEKV